MKKITTKLSNLHKLFEVYEYEKEKFLTEDIFIETPDNSYVKINALVRKHTEMISCVIENIDEEYVCAKHHLIATPDGWTHMIDADAILDKNANILNVISKKELGFHDSFDVALDYPHTYCTANGLVHHNTFLSAMYAAQQVSMGNFDKIIISRPAIATGKSLGFFPGTIEEKMMPWVQQIINYLKQFLGPNVVNNWMHGDYQKIILEPMETLRGRNFENCIVIIDESQQLSIEEIKCITTRVGKNCKLILCGDPKQKDIKERGLEDFVLLIDKHNVRDTAAIKFSIQDIVRSDLVKDLIMMFEYEGL